MTPSTETAGWVGKILVCDTCGKGWKLEAGDIVSRERSGPRNSSRARDIPIYRACVKLQCGHNWSTRKTEAFYDPKIQGRFE